MNMMTAKPRDGKILGFRDVWKSDLLAGFQVFLIALPLCLGISLASGFPPIAGVVTAIVGGIIVSRLSGSHVTINGPAAGLIVVILSGVEILGKGDPVAGYRLTLAAIVIAGALEVLIGMLRLGRFCAFFPISAVHGMLAAIGVIIMAKQLPVVFGVKPQAKSIFGLLAEIPSFIAHANPLITLIGATSFAILIGHLLTKNQKIKRIPAPIIVVGTAALIGYFTHLSLDHMVELPREIFSSLLFPDFSQILTSDFIKVTLSIAIIAGLESMISALAVDKLDKLQRKTDLNRDIIAVGIGTMTAGLLGGLPMIAEIVRSSANVNNGAKTGWSNFFHGIFLLVAILVFPNLIRQIPLAALAALLVFTGYRLASPQEIRKAMHVGMDQLTIFLVTLFTVLATDLLVGVAAGVLTKVVLHFLRGVPLGSFFQTHFFDQETGDKVKITVTTPVIFTNLLRLTEKIRQVDSHKSVQLDLTAASFIDHTALEVFHGIQREFKTQNRSLEILESDRHQSYAPHPLAARKLRAQ